MAKKSLFSPKNLYELADSMINMYTKMDLVLKFARMNNNKEMIDAYSPIVWELNLLIETYGLREMVKID